MFDLVCSIQSYAWGKFGSSSRVGQIGAKNNHDFILKESESYAELWMGTHPKGPSIVVDPEKRLLADYIAGKPDVLGAKVREQFGNDLPFLFKVLSVRTALSIQAHPNKEHAALLHKAMPEHYPDDNHKPEMAIAITPFEALCGFRPVAEIVDTINEIPELLNLIGHDSFNELLSAAQQHDESKVKSSLQKCFENLMTSDDQSVKNNLSSLLERIQQKGEHVFRSELFVRTHGQFPGDVGCFVTYFLNYIKLQPGEALFLGPNEIHAYISGDCMECMACSDNVVRSGLTPKFKDVATLCQMLTYRCESTEKQLFEPSRLDEFTLEYEPPVPDFAVQRSLITASTNYILPPVESASILIVVEGDASISSSDQPIGEGSILFFDANETCTISTKTNAILLFRAFCKL